MKKDNFARLWSTVLRCWKRETLAATVMLPWILQSPISISKGDLPAPHSDFHTKIHHDGISTCVCEVCTTTTKAQATACAKLANNIAGKMCTVIPWTYRVLEVYFKVHGMHLTTLSNIIVVALVRSIWRTSCKQPSTCTHSGWHRKHQKQWPMMKMWQIEKTKERKANSQAHHWDVTFEHSYLNVSWSTEKEKNQSEWCAGMQTLTWSRLENYWAKQEQLCMKVAAQKE